MMNHPGLAALPCSECQKFVYSIPSAEPQTYQIEPDGEPIKVERPPDTSPPCDQCPKGSPEQEAQFTMSWENHLTVTLYRRFKTGAMRLPARLENDPILADNFSMIEDVIENADRQQSADRIAASMVRFMGWGRGRE